VSPAIRIYALATAAAGIVNLVWGDFALGWQPIIALGDHVPGRHLYAYATAIWLVLAGAAMLWRRSARGGAIAATVVYALFAAMWLPRLVTATEILGFQFGIIAGVLAGFGEQVFVAAAAVVVWALARPATPPEDRRPANVATVVAGLCATLFGVGHLTGMTATAALVPAWIPPSGAFWAILTGMCFVLAGIAIVLNAAAVAASRLLALMLFAFSAVIWVPKLVLFPHAHEAWGGNAYNLTAAAAAWILGDWFMRRRSVAAKESTS
jgi:uncharacterized membrane protein